VQLQNSFLNGSQPGLLFTHGDPSVPAFPFNGAPTRMLTLNEDFDRVRPPHSDDWHVEKNGSNNQEMTTWGRGYLDPVTENPQAGAVEVWQIMNLTADTHPIHFTW